MSAICCNLDQSKILSSYNGLREWDFLSCSSRLSPFQVTCSFVEVSYCKIPQEPTFSDLESQDRIESYEQSFL